MLFNVTTISKIERFYNVYFEFVCMYVINLQIFIHQELTVYKKISKCFLYSSIIQYNGERKNCVNFKSIMIMKKYDCGVKIFIYVMRNPNPLDGDTWFVSFITHISVQSVFSQKAMKLIRHRH